MENIDFNEEDYHVLENITSKIKQLELENCKGITDKWSDSLKNLRNLDKFKLTGENKTTAEFYKNFRNLSSLYIDEYGRWDLETIFDLTGHSLQHLNLYSPSMTGDLRFVKKLIIDKLPKLERLEVLDGSHDPTYPHLKSLRVILPDGRTFRYYSNCEEIEHLSFLGELNFDDEHKFAPPVFNELKSFVWYSASRIEDVYVINMLKAVTKAIMPKIHTFRFNNSSGTLTEKHITELLKLIQSKKSLKTLRYNVKFQEPFKFVEQLIDILKRNTAQTKLAFKLEMPDNKRFVSWRPNIENFIEFGIFALISDGILESQS